MNNEQLMDEVINDMSNGITEDSYKPDDDEAFQVKIPMMTGRVFTIDARNVDWSALSSHKAELEANEATVREMVYVLVTLDFMGDPEESNDKIKEISESLDSLFSGFGIDPGYETLQVQVQPYIICLAKCFDALTLIKEMAHHTEIHNLAEQIFSIGETMEKLDSTELMESLKNLTGDVHEDCDCCHHCKDEKEKEEQ